MGKEDVTNNEDPSSLFLEAVKDARPITPSNRVLHPTKKPKPVPHQLMRDERQALTDSLSDGYFPSHELETGEELLYLREGQSPSVLSKLRRGHWVVQAGIDLHGMTSDQVASLTSTQIGYFGSELPDVPFDAMRGVVRNEGGRVVDESGAQQPGLYATGWIKRGPVGLIGHTKSDAAETIENLLADAEALADPTLGNTETLLVELAKRGVEYTDWAGWQKLDAHERALGAADQSPVERERVKVVSRAEQVRVSRA